MVRRIMESNQDFEKEELLTLIKHASKIPGIKFSNESKIYRNQWLSTLGFNLGMILFGMAQGLSTILVDQMKTTDTSYSQKIIIYQKSRITVDDQNIASWIVSILQLCMVPSSWILVILDPKLGRKKILWISIGLFFISWFVIALAENVTHLLIGRGLSGVCAGLIVSLSSAYQGEVALPGLRTTLISSNAVAFSVGMGFCHALAIWFDWRSIALIATVISSITLVSICIMKESPIWLLKKKKFQKAILSWAYLRGSQDLEELQSMYITKVKNSDVENGKKFKIDKYCSPSFLKPLGILLVYFTVVQLSGVGAMMNYCAQIFQTIVSENHIYIATLILDAFRVLAATVVSIITKRFNNRGLSLVLVGGTALSLFLLSISLFLQIFSPWSPLILLFGYQTVVIGLMALPYGFCTELFPTPVKEIGLSILSSYNFMIFFIVLKANLYLIDYLDSWGTFLLYGVFTLVGLLILYYILPNTKNKSLKEIELMFSNS